MIDYNAFTCTSAGILNRLCTEVYVLSKYNIGDSLPSNKWKAVWDTGATKTCISQNVVDQLNLVPIGKTKTSTAGGIIECNTYCVDIILPNKVAANKIVVYGVKLTDCDLLIGMDIISYGDFTISNYNGKTIFSFRTPSIVRTDYVEEYNENKSKEQEN